MPSGDSTDGGNRDYDSGYSSDISSRSSSRREREDGNLPVEASTLLGWMDVGDGRATFRTKGVAWHML